MKKNYIKPEMEITVFSTEDIITASSVDSMNINTDTVGGAYEIDARENNWVD